MHIRDRLLLLAFTLSGAAGLGYELVWTRLLTLALGSETLGVLATLGGFFGGMAIGAAALHNRVEKVRDPARAFALLELTAAAYALASPYLLTALARALPEILGGAPTGLVALGIATAVLLPGTFCLGATLPALVAAYRRVLPVTNDSSKTRGLGRLYAANTIGATLGTLGAVYVLMPNLGLTATVSAWALAGCLAAVLALRWSRRHPPTPVAVPAQGPGQMPIDCSRDPDSDLLREPWLLYMIVFATGLAGVGLEVVGVTVLAQNFENTIYTFANTLAVYLLGTALGAAIYQRVIGKLGRGRPTTVLVALLGLLAFSTVLGALALAASPSLIALVHPETQGTLVTGVGGEMLATLAVFGLPTLCMGALFSHVLGLLSLTGGAGRAYALNTLGGALAPVVFGVVAIDALGFADAYYAITYGYLAIFVVCAWIRRFRPQVMGAGVLAVIALTAIGPRELALVPLDPSWKVLSQDQSIHGVVTVSEYTGPRPPNTPPLRRLQVGHQFRMGGALSFGERRMGHLSALLAGDPKNVLVLGVGTGATAGAAYQASAAEVSLDAVELVPAVAAALPLFTEVNRRVFQEPDARIHVADARRFLAASKPGRDLVIADLFHPARDGAGALYAREHFEGVRDHLAPGGLFVQWLPLHQLSPTNLKTIVRTFLSVFPEVHSFLGLYNARTPSFALVGVLSDGHGPGLEVNLAKLRARVAKPGMTIVEPRDLLAAYLLGHEALATFSGPGPLNTDLNPRVTFDAPATAYANQTTLGPTNLAVLLEFSELYPEGMVAASGDQRLGLRRRVKLHASALKLFLTAEITSAQTTPPDPRQGLADYLAAYDVDPEFPPARGALYRLARTHPDLAVGIFEQMLARTPDNERLSRAYLQHVQQHGTQAELDQLLARLQAGG